MLFRSLLLLQPEFSGSALTWDSLRGPNTRIWVPGEQPVGTTGLQLETLPAKPLEEFVLGADLDLRF